jgi:hypothetical protein
VIGSLSGDGGHAGHGAEFQTDGHLVNVFWTGEFGLGVATLWSVPTGRYLQTGGVYPGTGPPRRRDRTAARHGPLAAARRHPGPRRPRALGTPGHLAIEVAGGAVRALITGDCVHHPVRLAHAGIGSCVDIGPVLAGTGTLVLGTHFPPPTAGRVTAHRDAYRLDPVPPVTQNVN